MALANWDPMRELAHLRREFDRIFTDKPTNSWPLPFSRFSFLPGRSARAYPLLNLSDDADHVYVEALAPGIDTESLKVEVVRDQLSISGEKSAMAGEVKPDAYHRSERACGRFVRLVTLPCEVDQAGVKAEYRNGLLTVTLPKAEVAKPRQISVSVG